MRASQPGLQPPQRQSPSTSERCRSAMNSDLSSASSSSSIADYIGLESCIDVLVLDDRTTLEDDDDRGCCTRQRLHRRDRRRSDAKRKEFPPPIPSLARTENLPSHMPWVLRRHYTSDGRLVLTEEKVRHHEYFRAHRSNGRLTLQLVPLDGDVLTGPSQMGEIDIDEEGNKTEYAGVNQDVDNKNINDGDEGCDVMDGHDDDNDDEDDEVECMSKIGTEGAGKWLKYGGTTVVRSGSPCMLRSVPVQTAAIRPVHS